MSVRSTSTNPSAAGYLARIAVLVLIALLAATAVWLGTRSGNDTETGTGSSANQTGGATSSNQGTGSERVAPPNAGSAPSAGVSLPAGSSQTDGYPTGFPYTDLGAVALQVELAKAQLGFDYAQAASVAEIYADPAAQTVFEQRSHDAVALRRKQAGVPAEGEVPAPASYAVTPVAYTLEELDTDYYAVNLLSYITLTSIDGESRDGLYAGTQLVRWLADPEADNGGDWKVVAGTTDDIDKLLAQGQPPAVAPETAEFRQAGWIMLDPSGGTSTETGEWVCPRSC